MGEITDLNAYKNEQTKLDTEKGDEDVVQYVTSRVEMLERFDVSLWTALAKAYRKALTVFGPRPFWNVGNDAAIGPAVATLERFTFVSGMFEAKLEDFDTVWTLKLIPNKGKVAFERCAGKQGVWDLYVNYLRTFSPNNPLRVSMLSYTLRLLDEQHSGFYRLESHREEEGKFYMSLIAEDDYGVEVTLDMRPIAAEQERLRSLLK